MELDGSGIGVLLVPLMCRPYAWFTDEAVLLLLPAELVGVYRADESGRPLSPFGFLAATAIVELLPSVPIASPYFLWTTPAWLARYLYATGRIGASPRGIRSNASIAD